MKFKKLDKGCVFSVKSDKKKLLQQNQRIEWEKNTHNEHKKSIFFQCWKSIAILLYQSGTSKSIISSASSTFTPMNQQKYEHYYALEQALVEPVTAYWMAAHPAAVNQCTSWPFYPLDGLQFFIRFMIFRGSSFTWLFFFFLPWFFYQPWSNVPQFENSKYYPPFSPYLPTNPMYCLLYSPPPTH